MEVCLETLVPGMQDGNKAQFSTQLVLAKAKQRLGDGFKQDVEHHCLIVTYDSIEFVRQGKDDVEVFCGQQLFFSRLKPSFPRYMLTLWAVSVSATMIGDALGATMAAAVDMAAEIRGTATDKIGYDLAVLRRQYV